jgi:peptidoglycan/xylan/chitin deacetylase (PgdA/CDA1 family)
MAMSPITLAYHDVVSTQGGGPDVRQFSNYTITRADFVEQLIAIECRAPLVRRITDAGVWSSPAPLLFTFDDGASCALSCIAGELETRGWRAHIFIVSDWVGKPGFLPCDAIRELHRRGHVIGSHSRSHPERMSCISDRELLAEWRDSCDVLAEIVREPIRAASVAGGYYSRRVGVSAASAGIEALFTSEPTVAVRQIGRCFVLGRYVIRRGMPPASVARIAAGERFQRYRETAVWLAKKPVKLLCGRWYPDIRRALLPLFRFE